VFVRERIKALAQLCDIIVVAPVKWFPFDNLLAAETRPRVQRTEVQEGLDVHHPKYLSIPYVLRSLEGLFYFVSVLPTLWRIRRHFAFDLIDAHFAFPDGFAAVLLGKVFRKPVVITLRGTIGPHSRRRLRRAFITYALRRADGLLAVSASLKQQAVSLGIAPDRIRVASNGVDIERFRPLPESETRSKLDLPVDRRILLSVGHLTERKGFHRLIGALPDLLPRFPDLLLVIVGGPTYGDSHQRRLKGLIAESGLEEHVLLAGTQPHDRVPLWLSACDVFCLWTHGEGWANVFLEAMACGKPVVTTRVGGNEEVVASDDLGILVELGDTAGMVRALSEALERQWDHAGIRRYATRHTWDRVAETVFDAWTDAVAVGSREPKAI
jgi:glycosyltransferase involved in cell wall biosynthesis